MLETIFGLIIGILSITFLFFMIFFNFILITLAIKYIKQYKKLSYLKIVGLSFFILLNLIGVIAYGTLDWILKKNNIFITEKTLAFLRKKFKKENKNSESNEPSKVKSSSE